MNVLKLKGKMVENNHNVNSLSKILDIDRSTMYRKLDDVEKFTVGEANKIKTTLNLTNEEAHEIFFK